MTCVRSSYKSFNSWGCLDLADPDLLANLDVFAGDIRDQNGVRTAMRSCDVFLHLAAHPARDLCVAKAAHTSTSEVYAPAQFVPIAENLARTPRIA